jgi:hypothetical protein
MTHITSSTTRVTARRTSSLRAVRQPERRCQCPWQENGAGFFIPCFQDMTQEDLLCDYCRLNGGRTHGHQRDPGFA